MKNSLLLQAKNDAPSSFEEEEDSRTAVESAVQPATATDPTLPHPFCLLPGDPSILITTNVDLGTNKMDIVKAISKALVQHTGKPESYVAVSITDKVAGMIFGGSADPMALGVMYSIGAIAVASNGAITSAVTDLLEPYGVAADRIYINFFDMPRANIGWNRKTFAG